MDTNRLHEILAATTQQFRKGEVVEKRTANGLEVTEIYAMPHVNDAADLELVDMHFVTIGVDKGTAEMVKADLIEILDSYPDPSRLAGGPSYIEVGGVIGDQGAAFCLFALGKVLGLWDVVTPESIGFSGAEARQMAGVGFIMITGYRPIAKATVNDGESR